MSIILDLDALIPDKKFVKFRGEDHEMTATTTETYLKIVRAQRALAKLGKDADEEEQTKFAVDLISLAIPTIPKDVLMGLPLNANMKLVEVIQKEMTADMDKVGNDAAGEGGPGAGESTSPVSSDE